MALRGVNLGGWLVLERWITPSLFHGLKAQDEYSFCQELGQAKEERLAAHRRQFIVKDDFRWIARHLDAVRIPVPHWLFGSTGPYVGCAEYLDKAMGWADELDLKVILDIHTAPGSQNGRFHSGKIGETGWQKSSANINQSLDFVSAVCGRYGKSKNLYGIGLLNEPRGWINPLVLKKYYKDAYDIVRQGCGQSVACIISDYFAPWRWGKFMSSPYFTNIIRDTHLYQSHKPSDIKLDMQQHISKADGWIDEIRKMRMSKPVIVGEWSLALAPKTFAAMDQTEKIKAVTEYGQAQMNAFAEAEGWFYWTYKTEEQGLWNFRHCIDREYLT